ncbi:UNVERIFIED_CONTAM: Methyl-CpG-binding domain-containing protein 9 [Sesamum radiatum]|uniref:Methyl-CpG-binding domain-containing protein 9 n=1 Tax=Sesamum radiatum TaxID=300843 RepID=A0AAW2P739_SESRA
MPISSELTPFLGDILQSWNFLWRFREVLGLSKGFSFEELTAELDGSLFDGLSETHILMLQVLISEFPRKFENGSKRNVECLAMAKRREVNVPPLNDLTWPELARRYVLAILFMIADSESVDVREDMDMFRCLHGDGGPRCGALTGVVGLEADAWFLAAAINKIYGSLYNDSERLAMDDVYADKEIMSRIVVNEEVPGWVRELEPIKKLKTNVGSKIRNCINNSLAKEPPEWARLVLDNSISKEVYKANASGPTKKLALGVVAQFLSMQQNVAITKNRKDLFAISNIVMKQCRFVLRRAALSKETKEFCTLIQERFVKHGNCEEGILGSPAIISSLLNFRMMDMRLASGAYCGSHEAFAEEVQEFWGNVLIVFENDSQLVDLAKKSCRVFESLFDKEVVALYQRLINDHQMECLNDVVNEDVGNIAIATDKISKAPWGEGLCKVCGIDENNKKVLLCDTCDAEYHTYCLRPPLAKVPKGNWFCSFCGSKDIVQDARLNPTYSVHEQGKKAKRDCMELIRNEIADLAVAMKDKDYWELSLYERTSLLKFICDEILGTTLVREHLLKCESLSAETGVGVSSLSEGQDVASTHITESAPAPSNFKSISLKSSLRSEFLGVDSAGNLYWLIDSGASPWILVNEVDGLHRNVVTSQDSKLLSEIFTLSGKAYSSWASYQSDAEIKGLMDSIKDNEPIRRHLGDVFSQVHKATKDPERKNQEEFHPALLERGKTRAAKLLEVKYGHFVKLETTDFQQKHNKGKSVVGDKMYRCECLEPILPADYHCLTCHKTCFSTMEFHLHGNGKCNLKKREDNINLHGEGASESMDGHDFSKDDNPGGLQHVDKISPSHNATQRLEIKKLCKAPESSVRLLIGRAASVLTQLKINLLDMEAAVPKAALRSLKGSFERRRVWRMFVKHASNIYELLAAAIKKIYGTLYDDNERLATDDLDSDKGTMSRMVVNEEVPGWVQELEPIKKLKTNVGSKIRNCINNSLAKEPPEWARKVLDNSISKEVYKANASGPTKKLALGVVAQFRSMQPNLAITKNRKDLFAISNIVMKQCSFVLRQAALAKETKDFCTLIQERFVKHGNCEEGILGSPAIVSSLLNFRMIDMRLAAGAYCGSHEAFAEEVQEVLTSSIGRNTNVYIWFTRKFGIYFICLLCGLSLFWRNVMIVFGNDSQLVDSAKKSCRVFESLYDKEVVALYQKLINDQRPEWFNDALNKDLGNIAVPTHDSKGSWGEGFCKVCGIDENNKKVLLCDTCDAEYHTYCLRPPLTKVPKGNWFCSFCGPKDTVQDSHLSPTSSIHEQEKKPKGGIMNLIRNEIGDLAVAMREKNYWELSFYEKTSLLKFICDEILGTTLVRKHLLKCESPSNLPKNSNSVELQALRDKEDIPETGIGCSKFPGISEDAPSGHISESALAPSNIKLNSVGLGTKTLKSSLRSEFLGIDSGGNLYWIMDSGTSPCILVNEADGPQRNGVTSQDFELLSEIFTLNGKAYSSWASYQSESEIKRLMDSLKDDDPIRTQLRDTFSQRPKVSKGSGRQERQNQEELHPSLLERGKTRAAKCLELKYGPFVKLETTDFLEKHKGKSVAQDKLYRCDCLQPILPTDYHCLSCHRTCFSTMEFQLHVYGKCHLKKRESNNSVHGEGTSEYVAGHDFSIEKKMTTCSTEGAIALNTLSGSEIEVEAQILGNPGGLQRVHKVTDNVTQKLEIEKLCEAPQSSIRPLIGRATGILTQLKIDLLDMEAAVPKIAFRSSKGCIERRQMVQAVIVFEDMFRLEYIAYSWKKYWSFSAAAKLSTISALALRIYSLDAAINYDGTSTPNKIELLREADKRKRQQNPRPVGRPSKKQKETQK